MKINEPNEYLLALIGHPVAHSLSPPMHQAALAHFGLKGQYKLIDLDARALNQGVERLKLQGYSGFNVTVPHKKSVLALCDELTDEAKSIGAVNSVKIDSSGRLVGHNTDIGGFIQALEQLLPIPIRKQPAYIVGAGGAARAALCGLILLGWPEITIIARNIEAARSMVEEILAHSKMFHIDVADLKLKVCGCDLLDLSSAPFLLVNATPLGLYDNEIPVWVCRLLRWTNPQGFFFDLVYSKNTKLTPLVEQAKHLRLQCADGSEMLIYQAALAFEFWFGLKPPVNLMQQVLSQARLGYIESRNE